jgi:hypothetical protein
METEVMRFLRPKQKLSPLRKFLLTLVLVFGGAYALLYIGIMILVVLAF